MVKFVEGKERKFWEDFGTIYDFVGTFGAKILQFTGPVVLITEADFLECQQNLKK